MGVSWDYWALRWQHERLLEESHRRPMADSVQVCVLPRAQCHLVIDARRGLRLLQQVVLWVDRLNRWGCGLVLACLLLAKRHRLARPC